MTWLSFALRSVGPLLVTPLVLRNFTPSETTYWFSVIAIVSLLMMADFGFGPSFIRAIAYAKGGRQSLENTSTLLDGPNLPLLDTVYRALHRAYLQLTLVGGLVGAPLAAWAVSKPISELPDRSQGALAFAIFCISSFFVFRNSAYSLWLQGLNQIALVRRAEGALAFFTMLLTALAISLTHSFLWAIAAWQLASVASSLVVRHLARKAAPVADRTGQYSEKEVMAFIWPAAWRSGLGVLMSSAVIRASGVIFSHYAKPEAAAPYLFALSIMEMIKQISTAPFYSRIPWFSSLYGANKHEELIPNVRQAMARSNWFFVVGVIGVSFFMSPLLHLIHSKTSWVPPSLWMMMGFAYLVERVGAMYMQFYSLSNHILWHIANGISGLIYLIASFGLIKYLGAYAFPVAMLIAYLGFYTTYSARLAARHYQLNYFTFESRAGLGPAAAMLLCTVYLCWRSIVH